MSTSHSAVVSIAKFASVLRAAEAVDLDMTVERTTLGIAADDDADVVGFLPVEAYLAMWERLMRRHQNPALPMLVARVPVETHGLIGFLAITSQTLGESLERAIRFQRLWGSLDQWSLPEYLGDRVVLGWRSSGPDSRLGVRAAAEYAAASMWVGLQAVVGTTLQALQVAFPHAMPADVTAHAAVFGVAPRFGAARTAIEFDRAVLEVSLPKAIPQLSSYLERQCVTLLAPSRSPTPTVIRAKTVLRQAMLHGAKPSATLLAKQLNMSHRTLLRRLADEGQTYRGTLNETRQDLLRADRGELHVTTTQQAALLGFSSVSAFHRARRRWAGGDGQP
jgi:AraC-like DNA-binding protein